jgi:hypothetical protein
VYEETIVPDLRPAGVPRRDPEAGAGPRPPQVASPIVLAGMAAALAVVIAAVLLIVGVL